jgi:hypothetical protein
MGADIDGSASWSNNGKTPAGARLTFSAFLFKGSRLAKFTRVVTTLLPRAALAA